MRIKPARSWITSRIGVIAVVSLILLWGGQWGADTLFDSTSSFSLTGQLVRNIVFSVLIVLLALYAESVYRRQQHDARYQEMLASMLISAGDAIYGYSLRDGLITTWNRGAQSLFGYALEEVTGGPLNLLVPSDRLEELTDQLDTLKRGEAIVMNETVRLRKGGAHVDVAVSASPIRENGEVVAAFSITRDITVLKRGEAELKRLVAESQRHRDEFEAMAEMGEFLQSCITPEEAISVTVSRMNDLFAGWSGAIFTMDNSQTLHAAASWGDPESHNPFHPDECWALRRGAVHEYRNTDHDFPCPHLRQIERRSVCVPLLARGDNLGVIQLLDDGDPTVSPAYSARLTLMVAEQLGSTLANLKMRETLRVQSVRDPLTGLYNRRYMEETLERELSRARRNESFVAVIFIDLDHFKSFNDKYGHGVGDEILRSVGDFLKRNVRGSDVACRQGGEEFLIVLPDASLEAGVNKAREMQATFRGARLDGFGHSRESLTMSMGAAGFPQHGDSVEEVLRAADSALYQAKADGRDRVVAASSDVDLDRPDAAQPTVFLPNAVSPTGQAVRRRPAS